MKTMLTVWTALLLSPAAMAKKPPKEPPPAVEAAQPAADERGNPTEEHQLLQAMVGDWDYTVQWGSPMPPDVKETGEASGEQVLGGRFVRVGAHREKDGETVESILFVGYDRGRKAYTCTLMNNQETLTRVATGQYDPETKVLTTEGTFNRVGLEMPFKLVFNFRDKDTFTMELWEPGIYEIVGKVEEMTFNRKK